MKNITHFLALRTMQSFRHEKQFGIIVLFVLFFIARPLKAGEYNGTCSFNDKNMPCKVISNPFTMTMKWSDGVTEIYAHQGNGVFTDARGGTWISDPSASESILIRHSNGNRIGFNEW